MKKAKNKNKKAKKEKQMENTMYILTNRQSASTEYEISFFDFTCFSSTCNFSSETLYTFYV